jgi:hypothetical protein
VQIPEFYSDPIGECECTLITKQALEVLREKTRLLKMLRSPGVAVPRGKAKISTQS